MVHQNNVKIFGLGLGLLLATWAFLHLLHYHLGVIPTLLIFGFILFVIEKSLTWPWFYISVYIAILMATLLGFIKHPLSAGMIVSDLLSVVFLLIAFFRADTLTPVYNGWMKGAHLIGQIFTTIILGAVYFLVFTPVSFLLRLMGKDHMQRKLDASQRTYWQKKEQGSFSKERYQQQF